MTSRNLRDIANYLFFNKGLCKTQHLSTSPELDSTFETSFWDEALAPTTRSLNKPSLSKLAKQFAILKCQDLGRKESHSMAVAQGWWRNWTLKMHHRIHIFSNSSIQVIFAFISQHVGHSTNKEVE